ncbi:MULTISPECIES: LLM class flavin-dependent oxidoreductase [Actinomadura]|uniref:LLM class flavin-dependent oxidoreductase n=1 Tax=Actinomadura TaxID=1988 RepID=UPI0033A0C153
MDLYREAAQQAGHDPATLRTSINLHGYVGRTSQDARDTMYPYFAQGMMANNHQRGRGFAMPRAAIEAQPPTPDSSSAARMRSSRSCWPTTSSTAWTAP